jgi:glycosyltransferase involved in cell wall biosynthesis
LHIVHQYPPDHVGGVELYTQGLAQALAVRGHEVAIFTRRDAAGAGWTMEQQEAMQVYRAWAGVISPAQRFLVTWGNGALVDAFTAMLDRVQPDLVHVQHLMGLPTQLLDLVRARGLPYVVTLHDYWWVCANANLLTNYSHESCAGPRGYLNCTHCVVARAQRPALWGVTPAIIGGLAWRARRLHRVLDAAACLLTPSDFVRQWYAAHGVTRTPIRVLGLGVERPVRELHLPARTQDGVIRFLYLGGIAPLKGVHVIIEAVQQVRGQV